MVNVFEGPLQLDREVNIESSRDEPGPVRERMRRGPQPAAGGVTGTSELACEMWRGEGMKGGARGPWYRHRGHLPAYPGRWRAACVWGGGSFLNQAGCGGAGGERGSSGNCLVSNVHAARRRPWEC